MNDVLNIGLAALILGLAVWTIVAREAYAAVVGFIAYGLLLTLVWVQLHGIDVALTEAAIGGGLTGALLIGAAARLRSTEAAARAERPGVATRWLAAVLSAAVTGALAICVLVLPVPAPTLAPEVVANIAVTEVGNPITAVLLAFRAMDTLLEAIVLLFALIGVWSLAPDRAWGGRPGPAAAGRPERHAGLRRARAAADRHRRRRVHLLGRRRPSGRQVPGRHHPGRDVAAGHDGGPGRCTADQPQSWLRWLLVAGPLAFIAIGVVGAVHAGAFLAYPEGFAKPLILVIEFALMPTLTLILGLMLLGAPQRGETP